MLLDCESYSSGSSLTFKLPLGPSRAASNLAWLYSAPPVPRRDGAEAPDQVPRRHPERPLPLPCARGRCVRARQADVHGQGCRRPRWRWGEDYRQCEGARCHSLTTSQPSQQPSHRHTPLSIQASCSSRLSHRPQHHRPHAPTQPRIAHRRQRDDGTAHPRMRARFPACIAHFCSFCSCTLLCPAIFCKLYPRYPDLVMFHHSGRPPHEQTCPAVCARLQTRITRTGRTAHALPPSVTERFPIWLFSAHRTRTGNLTPAPPPAQRPLLPGGMTDARYAGGSMRLRKRARLFVSEQREEACCMQ